MSSLPNLHSALNLYNSDKIKSRAQGSDQLREIFSNRENLVKFQETASKEGGAGWVALFQCLFQVVVVEKKGVLKANANAQGEFSLRTENRLNPNWSIVDRRLAEAISLVRWMTERSVTFLSKKPFQTLFTHLLHLLVHARQIFPPASLDYAKALRALLSYPPHLESLDVQSWRVVMGVCWGSVLGEAVSVEDSWGDGDGFEDGPTLSGEEHDQMEIDDKPNIGRGFARGTVSQSTTELVSLIPILLSSSSAPLLSPLPEGNTTPYVYLPSYSLHFLNKVHTFLNLHQNETSLHLPILRALNMVLSNLELNSRRDFVEGGRKVFGQLVGLWGTRNKGLREQVVIALRMLLPFLAGGGTLGSYMAKKEEDVVREDVERLMEGLGREAGLRWGARSLDLSCLRLRIEGDDDQRKGSTGPYATRMMCVSHWCHSCKSETE
jgi:ataxia telangiectasia mutated family protein